MTPLILIGDGRREQASVVCRYRAEPDESPNLALYKLATTKPMSEAQKTAFDEKHQKCKAELAPKSSLRNAFKDGAKKNPAAAVNV